MKNYLILNNSSAKVENSCFKEKTVDKSIPFELLERVTTKAV